MILFEKDFFSKGFDLFLGVVRRITNGQILGLVEKWSVFLGLWLLAGSALAGFIGGLIDGSPVIMTIVFFLVGLALLFISAKFLDGLKGLVAASPTGFANRAVPDTIGILMFLGAIGSLVLSVVNLVRGEVTPCIVELVVAIALYLMSCAIFDDAAVNSQVGVQYSPGEEFLSIFLVSFKTVLLTLPVIFGLLSAAVFVFTIWGLFSNSVSVRDLFSPFLRMMPGAEMLRYLPGTIIPIILPVYAYFLFLGVSFLTGLFQGLLSLKKKG